MNDAARMPGQAERIQGDGVHLVVRRVPPRRPVATQQGVAVLLLHGWPGFSYDYRTVLPALAAHPDLDGVELLAPDLRGYGASDKPDLDPVTGYGPAAHVADLRRLLDHYGPAKVVVVGHDIGATLAQALARAEPDRVARLVVCDPPYPGIGTRRYDPDVAPEFWYQQLHQQAWAPALVAHDRATLEVYLRHWYTHWVGRHDRLTEAEFQMVVDAYAAPGAFEASIQYYRARAGSRRAEATSAPPAQRLAQPTHVLWGELDPVMRSDWSDRLGDHFADYQLRLLPGVGHFVPFEAPEELTAAIIQSVTSLAF